MATPIPSSQLPQRIQQLLEERQQHAEALTRIDQILGGIGAALGGPSASPNGKKAAATEAPAPKRKKRRRGRGHFALNAEESILTFVKQEKNPTTAEISQHLLGEGRSNGSINALTKLIKEKKLKRTPLGKGIRGSRYSLA